jgi:hypothetical protein
MRITQIFIFCALLLFPLSASADDHGGLVGNAITIVNEKRANYRFGLEPFIETPALLALCQEITFTRASKGHKGHLRNSMYNQRASAEGVGWGGQDLTGKGFVSCFLYSKGYKYASATWAVDDRTGSYYTLILSNRPDKAEVTITIDN